ncbi:MAG: hydantoinase B/oxoprolinase family protein [Candidatus Binataceae bacterium]|jgi:N-methylhydantoinase B/oxoprolinase/acetone carboxylase alpha subunit
MMSANPRPDRLDERGGIGAAAPSDSELLERFLKANVRFLGPDPEIMRSFRLAPRTEHENRVLSAKPDIHVFEEIRNILQGACDRDMEVVRQMVASPAGRFGDLCVALFNASGDMAVSPSTGVVAFSSVLHFAIRFILKYYRDDPSVGLKPGDCFVMNDSYYGGVHNPDLASFMPVFHGDELIAWASCAMHHGEIGASDPGGMGPTIESRSDEGLKLPPTRYAENYRMRTDMVTFLQNMTRDVNLMGVDLRTRMASCIRMEKTIHSLIAQYGVDNVVGALRQVTESVEAEARRRLALLPEGKVRVQMFADSTMREDALIKVQLEATIKSGELTLDFRGSSPQIANRPINETYHIAGVYGTMTLFQYFWPDLPHINAAMAPVRIVTDRGSICDAHNAPCSLNMQAFFKGITMMHVALTKLGFSVPEKHARVIAPWFNQPLTFIYGGVTQHMQQVGNLCGDINGMAGGAKCDDDGEHSISPNFAPYLDIGESELVEEDLPFLHFISKRLLTDNLGFGKFRGGGGYEIGLTKRGSPFFGFMSIAGGSKFPSTIGLFGGYGCPAYPLSRIKGVNVFDEVRKDPGKFQASMVDLMNRRLFANGRYSTHRNALPFELAEEGELYMTTQGAGGGYGDVLQRDPERVMKDIAENLISHETARDVFRVVYDERTLAVDKTATARRRNEERDARKRCGVPYREFIKKWNRAQPPAGLPYFGSWGSDIAQLWMNGRVVPADAIGEGYMFPDPGWAEAAKLRTELDNSAAKIAALEAELRDLRNR